MRNPASFIEGLHHIGMPTTDMDVTLRFYTDFGGKVIFEKEDVDNGEPIRICLIDFFGTVIECYERTVTPKCVGAVDHVAFKIHDIDTMYSICKENGYRFMEDCAKTVGSSSYWPKAVRWFIVYGPNEEKIEFCMEC